MARSHMATGGQADRYLAEQLNINPGTAKRWAIDGIGPPYSRTPGGHRRYNWPDLHRFVREFRSKPRAGHGQKRAAS